MGIGLFYDQEGLTVICEPFECLDPESPDAQWQYDSAWQDFVREVRASLPGSWETDFLHADHCRAGSEIAFNGLYSLFVKECESGNGLVFITIRARECVKDDYFNGDANTLNLAISNMHKAMNRIVASIKANIGPVRRRTSAWTSGDFWDFEPVSFTSSCL